MICGAGFSLILFGGISMNLLLTAAAAGGEASVGMSLVSLLVMIIPFGLLFYFMIVEYSFVDYILLH